MQSPVGVNRTSSPTIGVLVLSLATTVTETAALPTATLSGLLVGAVTVSVPADGVGLVVASMFNAAVPRRVSLMATWQIPDAAGAV